MKIETTTLTGLYTVEPKLFEDERGFFTRWYCKKTFKRHGLVELYEQGNLSSSYKKGTMRGLHYQTGPAAEAKLVRCSKGSIFDVAIDCRQKSATQYAWYGTELSAQNRKAIYIPAGFAHGYLTLEDESEIHYLTSNSYQPGYEEGLLYNDPHLAIAWPIEPKIISQKDATWPLLSAHSKETK